MTEMDEGFIRINVFLLIEFKPLFQDKLDPWVVKELDNQITTFGLLISKELWKRKR